MDVLIDSVQFALLRDVVALIRGLVYASELGARLDDSHGAACGHGCDHGRILDMDLLVLS